MKFETARLREAVRRAIEAEKTRHAERIDAKTTEYEDALAYWTEAYADQWARALTRCRAALRAGKPITSDMLPRRTGAFGGGTAVFQTSAPKPGKFEPSREMATLSNALDMIEDEQVSDAQLQRLGVSSRVLRYLFGIMPPTAS